MTTKQPNETDCLRWLGAGIVDGRRTVIGDAASWANYIRETLGDMQPRYALYVDLYLQAVAAGVNLGDLEQAERVRLLGRGR